MCVQYIGGCSVHRGVFSTSGGVQYIGGCSVHRGVFSTSGGYHEYIGGDIMIHVGEQVGENLSISIENPNVLNIPRCTHDIPPMYS